MGAFGEDEYGGVVLSRWLEMKHESEMGFGERDDRLGLMIDERRDRRELL
ncbi:hypothetical protein Hanom_Chr00s000006g01613751 [Helianthus anomalus]